MSFTKDQLHRLIDLLERNNLDGTKHATNVVRGESSSCYSAGAVGKHSNINAQTKIDDCKWILDTWATYRIFNFIEWLVSYSELNIHISGGLPNGTNIQALTTGRVKLHDNLVLEKVLYLLGFNINLIYVSRFSEKNNCTIVFEDDSRIIHERGSMKKISLAKLMDDLY